MGPTWGPPGSCRGNGLVLLGNPLRGATKGTAQDFNTNNNTSHTILVSNESSWWILSMCVNFNDEIYHEARVNKNKNIKKNTHFFSANMHSGGRVIKMAVICQRVIIWLQLCADMIAKTFTFHLVPHLSHLKHIQHCYKVIIAKTKFCPRGSLEFAILGSLEKRAVDQ